MSPRVEIVIDELVVRGLSRRDARAAAAAIEARLAELAATTGDRHPGTPDRPARVVVPAGEPEALGNAVAGAVWTAIRGAAT